MVFDTVLSTIDKVLSINLSANMFVFGGFKVLNEDWLTYSGGNNKPYSDRRLPFALGSLAVTLTVLLF